MTWLPEVEEITRRRTLNRAMGGEAAIQAKHARGELSIRERIDCLSDAGTFTEIGPISASAEYDDDGRRAVARRPCAEIVYASTVAPSITGSAGWCAAAVGSAALRALASRAKPAV